MFKRTKLSVEEEQTHGKGEKAAKVDGKGRPTPTRKEAEAAARARARMPADKRSAMRKQRNYRAENSKKIREGMKRGDERYFLPRDQGPVRRFIRDFVDVRFSIVEMVIPLMIIGLILGYSGSAPLVRASSMVLLATVVFVFGDAILLRFRLRRQLRRRFPEESLRGTTYYALTRSMQMKFMRMPKSRVKIGQELPEDYHR